MQVENIFIELIDRINKIELCNIKLCNELCKNKCVCEELRDEVKNVCLCTESNNLCDVCDLIHSKYPNLIICYYCSA